MVESYVGLFLAFPGTTMIPIVAVLVYIPTSSV
jgi:hypothetical protein